MSVIQVSVNQSRIEIKPQLLEEKAERILSALGYTDVELSILIVDDREMADMNRQYRHMDSTTDVLSFPMWEGEFGDVCMDLLGDVVISAPTAQRMAMEHNRPLSAILDLLLVHGILHLVGYDHERGEEAAREMETRSMDLLHLLGHAKESFDWYLKPGDTDQMEK